MKFKPDTVTVAKVSESDCTMSNTFSFTLTDTVSHTIKLFLNGKPYAAIRYPAVVQVCDPHGGTFTLKECATARLKVTLAP